MKFGQQLRLKTVPEWRESYVSYSKLKRLIDKLGEPPTPDFTPSPSADAAMPSAPLTAPLLGQRLASRASALPPSEQELESFSWKARRQTVEEVSLAFWELLEEDFAKINALSGSVLKRLIANVAIFEEETKKGRSSIRRASNSVDSIAKSMRDFSALSSVSHVKPVYVECVQLKAFVRVNYEGVRKIVKKWDKASGEAPKQKEIVSRLAKEPFSSTDAAAVNSLIQTLESLFPGHVEQLREAAKAGPDEGDSFPRWTPFALSVAAAVAIYLLPIFTATDDADADAAGRQHRCLCLLLSVVLLWLTEALPYFATALFVPPLVVLCDVVPPRAGEGRPEVTTRVIAAMFGTPIILQVLAGLIAAALVARCEVELRAAIVMQRLLGHRPQAFLLSLMMLGLFMSCLISNVTAPILLISVMTPLLHDLPSSCRYTRAVLLGLAFSCNLGGMLTPISAPQNAVSMAALQSFDRSIGFGQWMLLAVPIALVGTVACWLLLLFMLRPDDVAQLPEPRKPNSTLKLTHYIMLGAVLTTIVLWALLSWPPLRAVFGEPALVGLLLLVVAFGSGFLTKDDFNSVSWHLLALIAGGNTLGLAVKESGLLTAIASGLTGSLDVSSPWILTLQLTAAVFGLSVVVSHTVAAIVIMPLVASIGMEVGAPCQLVILCALACSSAMALPMSSFPNVSSLMVEDDLGAPYLAAADFLKPGSTASICMFGVTATLGYVLAICIGFD